jgi:peptidoglycan/xylan/chitin deacetylase (PgdA/CDA1 family)
VPARIALTFEAGGEAAPAPAILAALDSADARATFFLDGRWAEANEGLVRSIAERGHELGNHGYRHPDWTTLSSAEIDADLTATERVAERLTGRSVKPWARPPYGAVDERVVAVLRDAGYHAVYRDAVDGGHWPGETTAATVRDRALRSAHDGGVIVFHTNRAETPAALPEVIDDLRAAGLRPGTLSELGGIPTQGSSGTRTSPTSTFGPATSARPAPDAGRASPSSSWVRRRRSEATRSSRWRRSPARPSS